MLLGLICTPNFNPLVEPVAHPLGEQPGCDLICAQAIYTGELGLAQLSNRLL